MHVTKYVCTFMKLESTTCKQAFWTFTHQSGLSHRNISDIFQPQKTAQCFYSDVGSSDTMKVDKPNHNPQYVLKNIPLLP